MDRHEISLLRGLFGKPEKSGREVSGETLEKRWNGSPRSVAHPVSSLWRTGECFPSGKVQSSMMPEDPDTGEMSRASDGLRNTRKIP
ncbi:hypothetical protein LFML04_0999 [Leptospirillum ferriphilum ML-04]|jgi:hypothetical protein|uniref:Uncharacterized protein n=1 Tax=Leptospirillum ferriphilum (strain ML-04) TaxID=1048260 RepID=J9Z9N3_LEPFM|nr:hypothetical protein LFML04_0999 [Leptospirillum ferriphilum ML-04]